MTEATSEFGRFRRFVWPIHRRELKCFIAVLAMAFFVGFIYHIVRNMKDALIVTAASSGAEAIPFLKLWAMLPMAIFWTAIFVRLSNRYSSEKVFYIIVSCFLAFFFVFTFALYPFRDVLHPHETADYLRRVLPIGCKGLIAMFNYWTYSIFYGMAELWGVIVFAVLFWGYINEVTPAHQAKRFYGLLGLGANIAAIAAGQVSRYLSEHLYNPNWIIGSDRWHQSLIMLTVAVLVGGLIIMVLFYWWTKQLDKEYPERVHQRTIEKTENKGTMWSGFAQVLRSPYLRSLAIVVVSYNIVINLTEVLWKDRLRLLMPDPNEYAAYMGSITSYTGILSTFLAIFVAGNVLRRFGWAVTALITPAMLLLTSIGFFAFYFMPDAGMGVITSILNTTPLAMVVLFGSLQNILSRASKYTVFDASKEMAYIPLPKEERASGKACIDGVASRMGKSGGSLLYQGLLLIFKTLPGTAPCAACLILVFLSSWISAVFAVGRRYVGLTSTPEKAVPAPAA